jgi:hypothetical protein
MNKNKTIASILEVLNEEGNRIYKLSFSEPVEKSERVHLDLTDHIEQEPFYHNLETNNTVDVMVHNCKDLRDKLGNDIYYAWQPRLPGKPSACPRCKTRMDIKRGQVIAPFLKINPN